MSVNNGIKKLDKICVVGLGAVGLPLAVWCAQKVKQADKKIKVLGVDIQKELVEALREQRYRSAEPQIEEELFRCHDVLRFSQELEAADIYLLCLPTSSDAKRGTDAIGFVAKQLVRVAPKGARVMLISTVAPYTTRNVLAKTLEVEQKFIVGESIFVAHCPERIAPGFALKDLETSARIVGGVTKNCTKMCAEFWQNLGVQNILEAWVEEAEAAKIFENTYRYVNIALANELADIAYAADIDPQKVFALANSHPRVHLHDFGIGAGGSCLPMSARQVQNLRKKDLFVESVESVESLNSPRFIQDSASILDSTTKFLEARPQKIAKNLAKLIGKERSVAFLGLSYKQNAPGLDESPAYKIFELLAAENIQLQAFDPYHGADVQDALHSVDVLILAVAHKQYVGLEPAQISRKNVENGQERLAIDLCNGWEKSVWEHAGFRYISALKELL